MHTKFSMYRTFRSTTEYKFSAPFFCHFCVIVLRQNCQRASWLQPSGRAAVLVDMLGDRDVAMTIIVLAQKENLEEVLTLLHMPAFGAEF
eukprot:SAG11_NODE_575_length_8420_cov_2.398149_12_plen_90_part_00